MSSQSGEEWLSLREAAELLGMHPATVRVWADRSEIPSRRTSGGHRRFRRADIEARLREETEPKQDPVALLLTHSLLGRIRIAFTDGTMNAFPWYQHFDSAARDSYRQLGQRLLNLLMRALSKNQEIKNTQQDKMHSVPIQHSMMGERMRLLKEEAVELGSEYGTITRKSHVQVADAVRAFLYFQTLVNEGILQIAEVRSVHSQDVSWIESLYQNSEYYQRNSPRINRCCPPTS